MKKSNEKIVKNLGKIIRRNTMKKLISIFTAIFTILGLNTSVVKAEENESYGYILI